MRDSELINEALTAMHSAYAPYSKFYVGAALLTADGKVYRGCNIENSSYPAGICAERAAISSAVTDGCREFSAIAITGGKNGIVTDYCTPCGICRQVISEFCGECFEIILYNGKDIKKYCLSELLPHSFGRKQLCE